MPRFQGPARRLCCQFKRINKITHAPPTKFHAPLSRSTPAVVRLFTSSYTLTGFHVFGAFNSLITTTTTRVTSASTNHLSFPTRHQRHIGHNLHTNRGWLDPRSFATQKATKFYNTTSAILSIVTPNKSTFSNLCIGFMLLTQNRD